MPCQSFVPSFQIPLVSSWFCDFDSRVDALYSEGKTIVFHTIDALANDVSQNRYT